MAYVAADVWVNPPNHYGIAVNAAFVSTVIDATGEKFAFIGQVRKAGNITKVGFRFGTVVKSGGSGLTVSLQNVDTANGPPFQPDGTQDQTVAIANGNAAFVSNTWIQTAALSASRTVARGDLLAVVVEYDGSGRLGADTVGITTLGTLSGGAQDMLSGCSHLTASWAVVNQAQSSVILEYDDGTFETLGSGNPVSAASNSAINNASIEVAMRFSVAYACKVNSVWMGVLLASSAVFDLCLYEGTTLKKRVTGDANIAYGISASRYARGYFDDEVELTPGTDYYVVLQPTSANNVTVYFHDVAAAGHWQAHPGKDDWCWAQRAAGSSDAWVETATRRPQAGFHISALSDSAVGGGGGIGGRILGG